MGFWYGLGQMQWWLILDPIVDVAGLAKLWARCLKGQDTGACAFFFASVVLSRSMKTSSFRSGA